MVGEDRSGIEISSRTLLGDPFEVPTQDRRDNPQWRRYQGLVRARVHPDFHNGVQQSGFI